MNNVDALMKKIDDDLVIVGVIGLGYVGLPLAVSFARKNIAVIGFEKSAKKADSVNKGQNYIGDVDDEELVKVVKSRKLVATTDFTRIKECDADRKSVV